MDRYPAHRSRWRYVRQAASNAWNFNFNNGNQNANNKNNEFFAWAVRPGA